MTTDTGRLLELPCDHCGRPKSRHFEIVGAGKVCPANVFTFSNSKSARIESLISDRAKLREALEMATKMLDEGGFAYPAEWLSLASTNTGESNAG